MPRIQAQPILLGAILALVAAAPAHASSPIADAVVERLSRAACIAASGLRNASAGPVTRFSDRVPVDIRTVTGTYRQPHMQGARGTMLCAYNRANRRVETQELAGGAFPGPVQPLPPSPPAASIPRDLPFRVIDLGGVAPIGAVTLALGSDGNIAANGGCNGFGGRYMLTGEGLKIYGPMIGTQIACSAAVNRQERRYQQILLAAQSIRRQLNGEYRLYAEDGRTLRLVAPAVQQPR